MAQSDRSRWKLIGGIVLVGAVLVAAGYATFDQWAILVARILAGG